MSRLIKRGVVADVALEKPGENGAAYDVVISVENSQDIDLVRKVAGRPIGGFPVVVTMIDDTTPGLINNR